MVNCTSPKTKVKPTAVRRDRCCDRSSVCPAGCIAKMEHAMSDSHNNDSLDLGPSSADLNSDESLIKFRQQLGANLKRRREVKEKSQRQFASECSIAQSQLSEIERGKTLPTWEALFSMCRGLDVKPSTIINQAESGHIGSSRIFPFSRVNDSYESRLGKSATEKHLLAEFIAYLFRTKYREMVVGIDGGTTNQFVADAIGRDVSQGNDTVKMIVTNHIGIPRRVSVGEKAPEVYLTAGIFRPDRKTLFGRRAVRSLEAYQSLAASVVGVNGGRFPDVFTIAGLEDDLKHGFMQQSQDVIIPVEPSKWNYVSGLSLANLVDLVEKQGKRVFILTTPPIDPDATSIHANRPSANQTDALIENACEMIDCGCLHDVAYALIGNQTEDQRLPAIKTPDVDIHKVARSVADIKDVINSHHKHGVVLQFCLAPPA